MSGQTSGELGDLEPGDLFGGLDELPDTIEVATYIADMLKGMRHLAKRAGSTDLNFLNYLLAMAEDEASKLAANAYH